MVHVAKRYMLMLVVLCFMTSGIASGQQQKPQDAGKPQDRDAKDREYFTDLELITHEGKKVRFYTDMLKDKVVLISTYYLNCGAACPAQNIVLSKLQGVLGSHFGKDIFIISVSVDPANDKWELVKDYAKVWDAKKGWTFLTGKKVNMDWVNYKLGVYVPNPEEHDTRYILMNMKTGRKKRLPPNESAEVLAFALLALLDESKNP
jgi:protein SCO1/2